MSGIESEIKQIIETYSNSEVSKKEHITNWTKPYGKAIQYSLYNSTGDTKDFANDHNISQFDDKGKEKKFFDSNYKNTYNLFKMFQHAVVNFRLNGMGKNSGLSPHKEYNIHGERYRIRFHLPVFTNNSAWVMLDDEKFWLKKGYIYFFNNGLIHSAGNNSEQTRYHLVWDTMLDQKLFDEFLDTENIHNPHPELVSRIGKETISELMHSEPCKIGNYEDQKVGTISTKGKKGKLLKIFQRN